MRLPFASADLHEQVRLRRDVVSLKREMAAISAQDEFSKWAKLRRQHDKALEAHDKKAESVAAQKSSFASKANIIRWTSTTGLRFGLQFWHAKTPIYTYPRGWLPWYVEWVLGFPRCPSGGVSINVWSAACAAVIVLANDILLYLYSQVQQLQSQQSGQHIEVGAQKKTR